jgi:purine-binding chemotaxis protein CheW
MLGKPLATVDNYLVGWSRRGRQAHWHQEVLAFDLGPELYGVDIKRLRAIVTRRPVTEVPRTPPYLLGIVSLRGQVVPLVDLRRRLGLPPVEPGRSTRILVVDHAGEPFGLLVDGVRQVVRLAEEEIEVRPPALAGRESEFVAGIARPEAEGERPRGGAGMVILLALDAVLRIQVRAGGDR